MKCCKVEQETLMKWILLEVVGIQILQTKCSFHQNLDEPRGLESTGLKQNPEQNWGEQLEGKSKTKLVPTTFGMIFFAEGTEDKPPALGVCIYSKIPCNATESFILHPPDLHSCCWHKNQLPCCVALIEAPLLLLPEHINAFKKLISPKLLPGHVLRR